MATRKELSASRKDYLEAIYHICSQKGEARSKDIKEKLKVTGPSVTEALQLLAEKGLINYAPYQTITLTQAGRMAALTMMKRHAVLCNFFIEVLHVAPDIAAEGACKIEHVVPAVGIERMIRYVDFLKAPSAQERSLAACFADYLNGHEKIILPGQDTEII
ncbi:MAG: metal-dependent transcriptional regulator [Desulfosarcina sp.]|nr:metal-dependent transcriptional regulator [Desulfobacterales bacterium]